MPGTSRGPLAATLITLALVCGTVSAPAVAGAQTHANPQAQA